MAGSPTQRTLKLLRKEGYTAQVVEKRIPGTFRAKDLFDCIDIIAIRAGEPVLGIQVTSRSNQRARVKKSLGTAALLTWLKTGSTFEVHGWAKTGKAGKRKLWTVTRTPLTEGDFKANSSQDDSNDVSDNNEEE